MAGGLVALLLTLIAAPTSDSPSFEAERAEAYNLGFAAGSESAEAAAQHEVEPTARAAAAEASRHAYARGLADAQPPVLPVSLTELMEATRAAYRQGYTSGRSDAGESQDAVQAERAP